MKKLKKEWFDDVIVFSFSEPGAMGPNNMRLYKRNGEWFEVDYLSEETPYSMIKEYFPVLKECYWNGPMRNEAAAISTIVIGGSSDDRETCVAEGWKHIYLDYGNHLAVKKELFYAVKDAFYKKNKCDITFEWSDILNQAGFSEKINEIESDYYEQEKKDKILKEKLSELQENPEYIKRVKEASGDLDRMMEVLEEFSGIKMTWFEFKQFAFRDSGLI